jgi:hypothetical protein
MLPEFLEILVTLDGQPCAGVGVTVGLVATRKNDFTSVWGPSDRLGKIIITGRDLLADAKQSAKLLIMDYGDPERDFSGKIRLRVMRKEDVDAALKAYEQFSPHISYRSGYRAMLDGALGFYKGQPDAFPIATGLATSGSAAIVYGL